MIGLRQRALPIALRTGSDVELREDSSTATKRILSFSAIREDLNVYRLSAGRSPRNKQGVTFF